MYLIIGLALVAYVFWRPGTPGRPAKKPDPLDRTLFTWADTPFKLRHLCTSVICFGAAGSGKTSGAGRFFLDTLLAMPNSGGIFISSKPEDRADVIAACKRAGRLDDLIIFGPDEPVRWNFLDALGGDTNNIVNGIDVVASIMSKESGHSKDPFYPRKRKELFYHAVAMIRAAGEVKSAINMLRFIMDAAKKPETVKDAEWRKGYHWFILQKARAAEKSKHDGFDFQAALEYWMAWPQLDAETRSNIEAEATGVLAPMLQGVVRDLIGTESNFSFDDLERGRILLVDMPLQKFGESGRMVGSTIKYVVQKGILARHAKEGDGVIFVFIDECHNFVGPNDPITLAEQRSHKGVAIYLTQSIHAFNSILGEHATESLLTNFGTKVFHQLGDAKSAAYASGLLGSQLDVTVGGSPKPSENPFDGPEFVANFNQNYLPVLQPAAFMSGLRTSGGIVDAIVIRPEPFASGERHALVSFNQERP